MTHLFIPDDEVRALLEADTLDMLPSEALIASIKSLAENVIHARRELTEVYDGLAASEAGLVKSLTPAATHTLIKDYRDARLLLGRWADAHKYKRTALGDETARFLSDHEPLDDHPDAP